MKNFTTTLLQPIAVSVLALGVSQQVCTAVPPTGDVPGQVVARMAPGHAVAELLNALSWHTHQLNVIQAGGTPALVYLQYELGPGQSSSGVAIAIANGAQLGFLRWGEHNRWGGDAEGQTGSLWVTGLADYTVFASQYAIGSLRLGEGWARSRGAGVTIAIVDSGVDMTHEAVQGPQAMGNWDFVGNDNNPNEEGDGIDNDNDGQMDESVGHGTYVASLIRLVAPESRQIHLRVLDDEGNTTTYQIAQAIYRAIESGADVINVSIATADYSALLSEACAAARDAGIIVLGAMGNHPVPNLPTYPAYEPTVCAVGATNWVEVRASFSGYGTAMDVLAPGATAAWPDGPFDDNAAILGAAIGGGYSYWQGTSFSTAFASGCVALVRAQYPQWPDASVPANQIFSTTMGILGSTAQNLDATEPANAGLLGYGLIDIAAATAMGPVAPSLADLNGDGTVNGEDLGAILVGWGACAGCTADLTGDGVVNGADLTLLFTAWGN